MDIAKRIQTLRTLLNQYNHEYYVLNQSTVDDATYDQLMKELIELETNHPLIHSIFLHILHHNVSVVPFNLVLKKLNIQG